MSAWFDVEWLGMGGHGVYVWSSYALFVAMLAWDGLITRARRRRTLRQIACRAQREHARASQSPSL